MTDRDKHFNSAEFQDILKKYEDSQRLHKNVYLESDELTDIAEFYYKNGNNSRAVEVLDYAIALHPGASLPLVFRARTALLDENNAEKAKFYARQITDQLDLDCIYLKAEIMISEGKEDDADNFLHECMQKIDEDDVPDYVLDVSTLYMDYNLTDKASEWLDMSDEPELADYRELKGRIAFGEGKYEESERIFESLLDEDPYSTNLWNNLASTQYMRNHINDSITSSEFSIAIDPNDDEAILNKANGLYCLCNFEEALAYYRRFISLCPNEPTGYMFAGNALLNLSRFEEAEEEYRVALSKTGNDTRNLPDIYQNLAFTLSQMNREVEAVDYIDKAEALPECNKANINVVRGHIMLEHGHIKNALNSFMSALNDSNFSKDIFYRVAVSTYDCGYSGVAYKMFKAYIEMNKGKNGEGLAYLASCCKRINRREEYLATLKKACNENPDETRIVFSESFPKGIPPEKYYEYETEGCNDNQ